MSKELKPCKVLTPGATTWCYKCKLEKPIKGSTKKNGLFCCMDCKIKLDKQKSEKH